MCAATRRQKELELQVLTGPVRNWQGQDLSTLGDIVHMGSVAVGPDHRDRYFVLFPHTLLILSVSQRMSAFIYEVKIYKIYFVFDSRNFYRKLLHSHPIPFHFVSGKIATDRNYCDSIGRYRYNKKCIRNQWTAY